MARTVIRTRAQKAAAKKVQVTVNTLKKEVLKLVSGFNPSQRQMMMAEIAKVFTTQSAETPQSDVQLKAAQVTITELRQELDSVNNMRQIALQKYQMQMKDLEAKYNRAVIDEASGFMEAQTQVLDLKSKISDLEEANARTLVTLEEQKAKGARAQATVSAMTKQVAKVGVMQHQLQQAQQTNAALRRKIGGLQEDLRTAGSQVMLRADAKIKDQVAQLGTQAAQIAQLRAKIEKDATDHAALVATHQQTVDTLRQMGQRNQKLRQHQSAIQKYVVTARNTMNTLLGKAHSATIMLGQDLSPPEGTPTDTAMFFGPVKGGMTAEQAIAARGHRVRHPQAYLGPADGARDRALAVAAAEQSA